MVSATLLLGNSYEITWIPGHDTMLASCHCGADKVGDDPIELWNWVLGHPVGH